MKLILKTAVLIIALLIIASTYVIFFIDTDEEKDNEPPKIYTTTGNTTGTTGKITTIYATFSDNVGVTEALLHYKKVSDGNWRSKAIINGSADIVIPPNSRENWYYYVTVNDAANNGPIRDPSTNDSSYYTITVSFENEDLTHYVFVEEGTVTWCPDCPAVRDIIHTLFESEKYNFYYVNMVLDKNDKAKDRLKNDYNIAGYPTLFIDGGYSVIEEVKNKKEESVYIQAIQRAEARDTAKIQVTVNAEYDKSTDELITEVIVNNYENETYTGRLRVYLTEINSNLVNPYSKEPEPFHYTFIDYVINQEIIVDANALTTVSLNKKLSDFSPSSLDPENLMAIAVVFNSESIEQFAYQNENPFDAYFADNTDATKVVEGGNLPPSVAIITPEAGKLHLLGSPVLTTIYRNTILIGRTTISVNVEDDSGIEKVEFYIDEKLKNTDTEEPYEWSFRKVGLIKHIIRKHTLMVKAYDNEGKIATDSIDVIAFFL